MLSHKVAASQSLLFDHKLKASVSPCTGAFLCRTLICTTLQARATTLHDKASARAISRIVSMRHTVGGRRAAHICVALATVPAIVWAISPASAASSLWDALVAEPELSTLRSMSSVGGLEATLRDSALQVVYEQSPSMCTSGAPSLCAYVRV